MNAMNSFTIWEHIEKHLSYRVRVRGGKEELYNTHLNDGESIEVIFNTLKLVRTLMFLSNIQRKYHLKDHFVLKALSTLKVLNKLRYSNILVSSREREDREDLVLEIGRAHV